MNHPVFRIGSKDLLRYFHGDALQPVPACGVAQTLQGVFLQLADALAGDAVLVAQLGQGRSRQAVQLVAADDDVLAP